MTLEFLGTMRVIVYIYIVAILVLLLYTSIVYFITEKYQPREPEDDRKTFYDFLTKFFTIFFVHSEYTLVS